MIEARLLVCFLLSFGVCAQLAAQDEVLPVPVPFTGYHSPLQAHRLVGAFWRTDHTFVSTLTIKNIVEMAPIQVTPTLALADGTSYPLAPILLKPSGVATLNINKALAQLSLSGVPTYGTISLSYSWHWQGAITGEVQEIDSDRSLSYTSGLRPEAASGSAVGQTVEGLWWRRTANSGGYLRLSNVTQSPIVVSESFFAGDPASGIVQAQTLAPGQTAMLSLKSIFDAVPGGATEGGLRLSYTGQVHGIAVDGGLEDSSIGFSARLKLGPVAMQGSSTPAPKPISLSSVGLMIGHPDADMMFPSQIVFHPYLVVRNTTGQPRTISVAANYQFGTAASTVPLLSLVLAPDATQRVDVESAILQLGLNRGIGYVNLVYSFTGASSDLLVSAGSIDGAGNYVFETPASPNQPSMARTLCYWQIGDGFDTMFTIYNYSASAEDLVLALSFDGGTYKLTIHLDPGASTMLDMEDIVARQTPDADGNTIPAGVTEGSAKLSGSRGELQHIRAAVSAASYNPSKATCNAHCIDCAVTLYVEFAPTPAFASMAVGKTQQMTIMGRTKGGTQYNTTAVGTWTSLNPNVATVGTGASQPGLVTAMSVGATSVSYDSPPVQLVLRTCGDPPECEDGEPITVDMPTTSMPSIQSATTMVYGTGVDGPPGTVTITGTGLSGATITSASGLITFSTVTSSDTSLTANYTVQCGESIGSGETITAMSSSLDGGIPSSAYNVNLVLPDVPAPTISFGGSTVSGTEQVVVGQQIALTANIPSLPPCMSLSSQKWGTPTSSGNPSGGFVHSSQSASITPLPSSSGQSYTFYWTAQGNPLSETFSYAVSGGGSIATSPTTTTQFNVAGPTNISLQATIVPASIFTSGNYQYLQLGNQTTSQNGITFMPTSTPPPQGFNNYEWFQILNSYVLTKTYTNGSGITTCVNTTLPSTGTSPYLDAGDPYSFLPTTNDSPRTDALTTAYNLETFTFSARMYYFFDPSLKDSIVVPLGYVDWQFSATAKLTNASSNQWTVTSSSQSASPFVSSSSYFTWNGYSPSPVVLICR